MEKIGIGDYNLGFQYETDDSQIGRLLRGAIDMHIHFSPEPGITRRHNALETALDAREMGLRAIVLKNRCFPTAPLASLISKLVPDIAVFGGVALEYEVGGLNPYAIEASAKMGAKVVWMPVTCAKNSLVARARASTKDPKLEARLRGKFKSVKSDGISILGTDGQVVPQVADILQIIKDYDMTLHTGHISAREIFALVDKAKQLGLKKMVVTHCMFDLLSETVLKAEERVMLAKEGILMEHTALDISPTLGIKVEPAEFADAIKSEGPRNCIMGTDFGHIFHPTTGVGVRMFIATMLRCGLSEEDINYMVKINPARLLGLTPEKIEDKGD